MATCQLCAGARANVQESRPVLEVDADSVVVSVLALIGVRARVHRLRLVTCPDCHPGRVTRHRELVVPLETEYLKGYLQAGKPPKRHL